MPTSALQFLFFPEQTKLFFQWSNCFSFWYIVPSIRHWIVRKGNWSFGLQFVLILGAYLGANQRNSQSEDWTCVDVIEVKEGDAKKRRRGQKWTVESFFLDEEKPESQENSERSRTDRKNRIYNKVEITSDIQERMGRAELANYRLLYESSRVNSEVCRLTLGCSSTDRTTSLCSWIMKTSWEWGMLTVNCLTINWQEAF